MGRNWDWSFQKGKEKRLELELLACRHHSAKPRRPPLHSHDATMQSHFNKGWQSVTQHQIDIHTGKVPPMPQGDGLAKLRSIKQCHF